MMHNWKIREFYFTFGGKSTSSLLAPPFYSFQLIQKLVWSIDIRVGDAFSPFFGLLVRVIFPSFFVGGILMGGYIVLVDNQGGARPV